MREELREKAVSLLAQLTVTAVRVGEHLQKLRREKQKPKTKEESVERQIPSVWDELG